MRLRFSQEEGRLSRYTLSCEAQQQVFFTHLYGHLFLLHSLPPAYLANSLWLNLPSNSITELFLGDHSEKYPGYFGVYFFLFNLLYKHKVSYIGITLK